MACIAKVKSEVEEGRPDDTMDDEREDQFLIDDLAAKLRGGLFKEHLKKRLPKPDLKVQLEESQMKSSDEGTTTPEEEEDDDEEDWEAMPISPQATMAPRASIMIAQPLKIPHHKPAKIGPLREEISQTDRSVALKKLYAIWTFHMTAWMFMADARMTAYLRYFKGDTVASANTNSRGMMAMMLSNLAVAPTLAKLSDAKGRTSLMKLGTSWCLLLRMFELISPKASTFLLTTSIHALGNATLQGVQTSIAELFAGDPQGGGSALALLQAGTLAGGVLGPALGSVLASRGIVGTRPPVALSAACSAAQLALILFGNLPETLPEEKRHAFGGMKLANPLSCMKLFLQGPRLAALAGMQLLSYLTEPIMLGRTSTLVSAEEGWSVALRSRLTSVESAGAIPGLACASAVVRSSMASGALLASVLAKAVQHTLAALWVKRPWQSFALVPLVVPHGAEQAVLTSMVLKAGAAAGLGQAELQACLQGLQSLGMLFAVFLWTRCFTGCKAKGRPRLFHLGPAAIAGAELLVGALAVAISKK